MPFLDAMQTYFRGERVESLFFLVPFGLFCAVLAVVAVRAERGPFGWGFAVPLLLLALLAVGVGGGVGLRTPAQLASLTALFHSDPVAFAAQELARMGKVNHNWPIYLAIWVGAVGSGIGLRFGLQADWARGLGIGLVFFGASGMIIDGFAERRAHVYMAALEALASSGQPPAGQNSR